MTSQWGHAFAFLAKYTWLWAPTQQANFMAQDVFEN